MIKIYNKLNKSIYFFAMGVYTSNASNEKLNIYLFGVSEDFRKSALIEANNNSNNIEQSQKSPGK